MARPITEQEITTINEMRQSGENWTAIGKALGRNRQVVRMAVDEEYKARRNAHSYKASTSDKGRDRHAAYEASPERKATRPHRNKKWRESDKGRTYSKTRYHRDMARDPEKMRDYARTYQAERRQNDPAFRISQSMRSRMNALIRDAKAGKAGNSTKLLGMTVGEWIAIQPAETVEAMLRGEAVHVDEIRPCSSFDLTDPEQQAVCFNWRNRQLMPAADNLSKSDKWDRTEWEAMMTAKGWTGKLF